MDAIWIPVGLCRTGNEPRWSRNGLGKAAMLAK